ncbi:zinc finger MYM-type 1-like protein [Labeo rohita]|uniref:Zinc finger MYM-type 1-like protein n=1 Tax=Labeo rohita TaxID=84645 RepID=A0A498MX72_LABRO|nr:zinc finger MYM-type 1-like protein [Labeo rohita]
MEEKIRVKELGPDKPDLIINQQTKEKNKVYNRSFCRSWLLSERIKKHERSKVHMENCIKLAVLGNISIGAQLDEGHRVAVCDTIMCHAKERFSFTKHLVSATLLQGDLFPQHHKTFPDSALDTTVEAYPSLDKARLKTELSLIYSNEDLFILFIYFICETGDFEEEIKSLLLIVIIV